MSDSGIFKRSSRIALLFADDDEDTRFAYQSICAAEGFDAVVAADGQEAMVLTYIVMPDCLVLDLRLPGLSGLELARRLHADERTCAIPIIILSGDTSAKTKALVSASGCDAHLIKPCAADLLFRVVSRLVVRRREPASTGAG